jgi:hypothetical protein
MDLPGTDLQAYLQHLSQRSRDTHVVFVRANCGHVYLRVAFFVRGTFCPTERAWHLESAKKALQPAEAAMWKNKLRIRNLA